MFSAANDSLKTIENDEKLVKLAIAKERKK